MESIVGALCGHSVGQLDVERILVDRKHIGHELCGIASTGRDQCRVSFTKTEYEKITEVHSRKGV